MVYIGQSVDIYARYQAHRRAAKNPNDLSHNTKIHLAMEEYGVDNFYLEILEECEYNELSEKEIYWIAQYDSYNNGYNMTIGGDGSKGESNGRALLTKAMVEDIRLAYANHIPFREVYKKYKNTISKRGLQHVWRGEHWQNIMMEVYTDENRKWHATAAKANKNGNKELGESNKKRACSESEIAEIRKLRAKGESYRSIAEQVGRSVSVVRKYCLFQESQKPNKIGTSIQIINIETGLVFESQKAASLWANCDHHEISRNKNTKRSAGFVPTTGAPAHWKTL